jgi:hypothetical protein
MIKHWMAGLFALGAVCVASRADACVTFYEDPRFGGETLDAGERSNPWMGEWWNDRISSLNLGAGCTVRVYDHPNFEGASRTFRGDVSSLGDWDERISSYICSCR